MKLGALLELSEEQMENAFREAVRSAKERQAIAVAERETQGFEDLDTSSILADRSFNNESFVAEISMSGLLSSSKVDLNQSQSVSLLGLSKRLTSYIPELPSLLNFRRQEPDEFENYKKNVYEVLKPVAPQEGVMIGAKSMNQHMVSSDIERSTQQCYIEVDPVFFQTDFTEGVFLRRFIRKHADPRGGMNIFIELLAKVNRAIAANSSANFESFFDLMGKVKFLAEDLELITKQTSDLRRRMAEVKRVSVSLPEIIKKKHLLRTKKKLILQQLLRLKSFRESMELKQLTPENFAEKWQIMTMLACIPAFSPIAVFKDSEMHRRSFELSIIEKSNELLSSEIIALINAPLGQVTAKRVKSVYHIAKRLLLSGGVGSGNKFVQQRFNEAVLKWYHHHNAKSVEKAINSPAKFVKRLDSIITKNIDIFKRFKLLFLKLCTLFIPKTMRYKEGELKAKDSIFKFLKDFAALLNKLTGDFARVLGDLYRRNIDLTVAANSPKMILEYHSEIKKRLNSVFFDEFQTSMRHLNVYSRQFDDFQRNLDAVKKSINLREFNEITERNERDIGLFLFEEYMRWVRRVSNNNNESIDESREETRIPQQKPKQKTATVDKDTLFTCLGLNSAAQLIYETASHILIFGEHNENILVPLDQPLSIFFKTISETLALSAQSSQISQQLSEFMYNFLFEYCERFQRAQQSDLDSTLFALNQLKTVETVFKNLIVKSICDDFEKTKRLQSKFKAVTTSLDERFKKWLDHKINYEISLFLTSYKKDVLEAISVQSPSAQAIAFIKKIQPVFRLFETYLLADLSKRTCRKLQEQIAETLLPEFDKLEKIIKDRKSDFRNEVNWLRSRIEKLNFASK